MKKIAAIASGLVGVLSAAAALAWSTSSSVITQIEVDSASLFYIKFDTAPAGKPACGASQPYVSVSVTNTDSQKAILSTATAALLGGRPVHVNYTGSCTSGYAIVDGIAIN